MNVDPMILCKNCRARVEASKGQPGRKPADIDLAKLKRMLKADRGLDDIATELGISWRTAQRYAARFRGGPAKRGRKPKKLLEKRSQNGI